MEQREYQTRTPSLGDYFLIPHELLHILGFWLVGKQCRYRWGNNYVTPIGPLTYREQLIGTLFPFFILSIIVVCSGILSGLAYQQSLHTGSLFWFGFWTGLTVVAGIYAGTAIIDLRKAYLLIVNKSWHSWTPFDFFFQPVINWDEIRDYIRRV
jgi:hypothetical protein